MKISSSSIFACPLAERGGIDSFSSPFLSSSSCPFAFLCASFFSRCSASKKGRNEDAPQPKALCVRPAKKNVGKRERERDKARGQYIYIYMRVSVARAFSVRRARTREEEEEEE